jgi:hypothetical protein
MPDNQVLDDNYMVLYESYVSIAVHSLRVHQSTRFVPHLMSCCLLAKLSAN